VSPDRWHTSSLFCTSMEGQEGAKQGTEAGRA
jgi:hypothetical protein